MIKTIAIKQGEKPTQPKLENLTTLLKEGSTVWIDITKPDETDINFLKNSLSIHELTIEDAKAPFHLPKIESYKSRNYLFIIWQVLNDNPKTNEIENSQVSFILGDNFVITIHEDEIKFVDDIFDVFSKESNPLLRGPDWVVRSVIDKSSEGYFPIVDNITDLSDQIEDEIFEDPQQKSLKNLFVLKRQLMQIRKVIAPQRDAVSELVRFEKFVSPDNLAYFRDIYDRLIRILDLTDSARDIISGSMDIYLSATSNRLNEIMKKLTILATIFGPLTIITGFFGMNFIKMPGLRSLNAFYGVTLFMIIFSVIIFTYFKKKEWW